MAGPYGTALLDDFTRANAGTLGANWTADAFGFGLGSFSIVSNQASSGSGFHSNWWSAASFGADQEAYFTFVSATLAGGFVRLFTRLVGPGTTATADGYELTLDATTGAVNRVDDGVDTQLGNALTTLTAGHKYAIACTGSTIEYWRDSGAGWVLLLSRTDATYAGGGSIGIYAQNVTAFVIDDFGGGTIGGDAGETIRPRTRRSRRTSW